MTEFLDISFADFVCFNVYLHREPELRRYLGRLQNLADFRPLVLSEFGVDSLREGDDAQAEILERTATAALELACAGVVVFSFTDEWFTGGYEIGDWCFGLVRRDRSPKPAYRSLQRIYRTAFPKPPGAMPRASVVICAYNAERTLEECLDSLRSLRYPDFEVIVVDDGSTDRTRAIAERYPEFRLISQENRGLSAARNAGIMAATRDVVAFTDSDCAVDPDWLRFLVDRLRSENFAGVGGPNLPPAENDWVPDVVARAPGGPTHVLLSDSEAEHVPGCNMAFWRKHLLDIGLFDPVFRAAGDDVDVCWRLQNEGYRIGYSPVALVWHRRRNTARAYLKQQAGYGSAESELRFKHPHRFNEFGHSRWFGRIYGAARGGFGSGGSVIYAGRFGNGLFQTLYEPLGSPWRNLPATLEWNTAALTLIAVGATSSAVGISLPTLLLAGFVLFGFSLMQALRTALEVDVAGMPAWRARALLSLLSYLGPLVRGFARNRHRYHSFSRVKGIGSPRFSQRARPDWLRRSTCLSYWNETGLEKEECTSVILEFIRKRGFPVIVDDGWQPWDLCLRRVWARGQINVLVENHGGKKRQLDVGMSVHPTRAAKSVRALYVLFFLLAGVSGYEGLVGLGLGAALVVEGLLLQQALNLARTFRNAIEICALDLPVMHL
jgi:glycosyltransferase involved in cell wall biosynthesis